MALCRTLLIDDNWKRPDLKLRVETDAVMDLSAGPSVVRIGNVLCPLILVVMSEKRTTPCLCAAALTEHWRRST
eukprot:11160627-Lingulodinium_polyedra.AAC.1